MDNRSTIKTFDQYKKLTQEQKELYNFQQLSKIDMVHDTMINLHRDLDKKYANKKVEHIVYGFVILILVGFAGGVISGVIPI